MILLSLYIQNFIINQYNRIFFKIVLNFIYILHTAMAMAVYQTFRSGLRNGFAAYGDIPKLVM